MSELIKLTATLTLVCLLSGVVIAFTHASTVKKIEAQKQLEQMAAVEEVFPTSVAVFDTAAFAPNSSRCWVGKSGEKTIGLAILLEKRGFSGLIKYIVGIDTAGLITGIKILSQTETPGLGARIEERLPGKSVWNAYKAGAVNNRPWFTEQFKGLSIRKGLSIVKTGEWPGLTDQEKESRISDNAISAITGATVSTEAIVDGIEKTALSNNAASPGKAP